MSEHEIQKQIMRELSMHHCTVFRANVGKVQMQNGRWFDTGLPVGFPDLVGYRWSDNKIFFVEVKTKTGRLSPKQIIFHQHLMETNVIHGVARSVKDALMIVDGGLIGYGY
ncbi:VRR-NUC domain-containing protein [Lactobacillus apis]|uniref:VRR-NUC domain-containing protein n=1 Tax=Lactobacillus apis TaxID=303541 RepID=UPI00164FAE81|nr:VRR-NUC domain-containing protein [Lactobacillus apis]MBC6360557.1 VRR-NUC domain-containing protein [Lactobacillus apis]